MRDELVYKEMSSCEPTDMVFPEDVYIALRNRIENGQLLVQTH